MTTETRSPAEGPLPATAAAAVDGHDDPQEAYDDPQVAGLLSEVAARMGTSELDALRRSLRTMLALYDAKAVGGTPLIRYKGTEQQVNLPGTAS